DLLLDHPPVVAQHRDLHALGGHRADALDLGADHAGRGDDVGAALLEHLERDAGRAIEAGDAALLRHAVLDAGDVAELDRAPGALGDDDRAELLDGPGLALGRDRPLARAPLDAAARELRVLAAQRVDDVLDREAVAGEAQRVEPDPHLALARAEQVD